MDAPEEKFAFDVIDPAMLEYLMRVPPRLWQLYGNYLVVCTEADNLYSGVEIEEALVDMSEFLEHIPEYVRQDMAIARAPSASTHWDLSS